MTTKIVSFAGSLTTVVDDQLREGLLQLRSLVSQEGCGVLQVRATVLRLAPVDGANLVKTRFDPLPFANGAEPAAAILIWVKTAGDSPLVPAKVFTAITDQGWSYPCLVEEHVQFTSDRWSDENQYVVHFGLLTRHAARHREDFADYWINVHGPLVVAHHPLYDRYVANVVTYPLNRWDGIVERWFTDLTTWKEHDRRNLEEKPAVIQSARTIAEMQQFAGTPLRTLEL